ncbi:hypothetical protein ZWY2020_039584 [Hordeum vulgare]|nr:hypothetical protein ZWY2020_039584 [Hordeum vulgare]
MPGLVSFFLRLIREDGRRYRLIARRRHGVGGLRRFRRRMQAIRRFGRDVAGRSYHGTRRDARGGYYASGSGLHAAGCAHRGAARARGPTPMGVDPSLVAGPSAPAVHGDAAAPAPPPGSPPPPPPPPTAWMAPPTPTPAAGPSRGPPGYVPVPMRAFADEEAALGFVSAPTGASGIIHLGIGMEGVDASAPPLQDMAAGSNGIAERRFGRLFGRAVVSLDRRPGHRPGSWAPASLGFAAAPPQAGCRVPADVVVVSSKEGAASSALGR